MNDDRIARLIERIDRTESMFQDPECEVPKHVLQDRWFYLMNELAAVQDRADAEMDAADGLRARRREEAK